jgi:hypothetical protein
VWFRGYLWGLGLKQVLFGSDSIDVESIESDPIDPARCFPVGLATVSEYDGRQHAVLTIT